MSKGKETIKHLGETSLLFATGVAFHCLSHPSANIAQEAALLGLSNHLLSGAFTLAGHVVAHGVYKGWAQTKENFKTDTNYHLEKVIINTYQKTFKELEAEIIEKYNLKEEITSKLFRVFFDKENKNYEDLSDLRENFLVPLLGFLTNNKAIEEMLSNDDNLLPEEYLIRIIEKVTPEYYPNEKAELKKFVTTITTRFKILFKHHFLQELKSEDKAKTVYFTHLLEGITLDMKDLKKLIPTINELCTELKIAFPSILKELQEIKTGVDENSKKLDELSEKVNRILALAEKNNLASEVIKEIESESKQIFLIDDSRERFHAIEKFLSEDRIAPLTSLIQADIAFERKEWKKAKSLYENHLKSYPEDSIAHNNYAILLSKHFKDYFLAISHFRKALRINPEYSEGYFNYANLLHEIGDNSNSKHNYQEAIRINPQFVDAYVNYAALLSHVFGDNHNAKKLYEEALQIAPMHIEAHINYANLLAHRFSNLIEAQNHFEEAVRISPENAEVHLQYSLFFLQHLKDFMAAKFHYKKATRINPNIKTDYLEEIFNEEL